MVKTRLVLILLFSILALIETNSLLLKAAANQSSASADATSFNLYTKLVTSGLNQPTDIAYTPLSEDGRLFIAEKAGIIRVVNEGGSVAATPFLDIQDQVFRHHVEAGLVGLVFDPDYIDNGFFYIMYTHAPSEDLILSRFQVESSNPNLANPLSETIILNLPQVDAGHNGGDMQFGTDGMLYVSIGDGGLQSEPNGQDYTNLLGSILRLNLDPTAGLAPECGLGSTLYSIPADNPFVGIQEGTAEDPCNEVWVYGLRNPWRFSFDRLNHDLYIGDVGFNSIEEIDYFPAGEAAGKNLGWACFEGNLRVNYKDQCVEPEPEYSPPIHEYSHNSGCAITGGFVYRGEQSLTMIGHYLFADYCSGHIWSLDHTETGWQATDHGRFLGSPSTFGEDNNGELYIASLLEGKLYRLVDDTIPIASLSIKKTAPFKVEAGAFITYTLTVSNKGNGSGINLIVKDQLPTGATYITGGTLSGNHIIWEQPILEPQHNLVVTMVVTATQTLLNRTYFVAADEDIYAQGPKTIITFVDPDELYFPIIQKD